MTKKFKIYGANGHRQRESFCQSYTLCVNNTSIAVVNSDITDTNEFSIVIITADTAEEIALALDGQLWDGIFENSKKGDIVEF